MRRIKTKVKTEQQYSVLKETFTLHMSNSDYDPIQDDFDKQYKIYFRSYAATY